MQPALLQLLLLPAPVQAILLPVLPQLPLRCSSMATSLPMPPQPAINMGPCLPLPVWTARLQERSLAGRLFQTIPKVLNVGLLVAALFHILELGSLLVDRGVEVSCSTGVCCALLCCAVHIVGHVRVLCSLCRCNCSGPALGFGCLA